MDEFANIWIEQCEAARDIRAAWGTKKALGYVIGEKFLNYIRASDSNSDRAQNIPVPARKPISSPISTCRAVTPNGARVNSFVPVGRCLLCKPSLLRLPGGDEMGVLRRVAAFSGGAGGHISAGA